MNYESALQVLWNKASNEKYSLDRLHSVICFDLCEDACGLQVEDLRCVFRGEGLINWDNIVHASRSLLSYYKMYRGELAADQLVCAVCCSMMLALAQREGAAEFWSYNDSLFRIAVRFDDNLLASEEFVAALSCIYSNTFYLN